MFRTVTQPYYSHRMCSKTERSCTRDTIRLSGNVCRPPTAIFTDTARIVCGRVYVAERCLSVCLSVPSKQCAAGLLLWARRAGDISRQRRPASSNGAAAARRSVANASSVKLSAGVGS